MKELDAIAAMFGVTIDAEASARIGRYLDLLALWGRSTRMTGERDPGTILRRHVADSIAPVPDLPASGLVVDIGAGAGFPGIVLASLRPDLPLVLLESRRRRVSFLREVIRHVPLPNARAIEMRAEKAGSSPEFAGRAKVVVSRAIRLDLFLDLARPLLAHDGLAIAMQVPNAEHIAVAAAASRGLILRGQRLYTLPDGARRGLLHFASAPSTTAT